MKIVFENSTELIAKLDACENIDLRKPLLKVGNDIEVAAKENCNGRFSAPTGALKRSIKAELISDNKYDADYDKDFDDSDLRCGDVCGIVLDDDSLSAELSARQIEEYANLYVAWVIE